MDGTTQPPAAHSRLWVKVVAGVLAVAVLLGLLIVFFPWNVLRGPLNRYVTERTGRHFEITRRLDVKLGRTTRVLADGIEFANPEWARDPMLVKAQGAEIHIELLPLLRQRIVLPMVRLQEPQLGLQLEPDGRRSWALGRDTGDPGNLPEIGALVVDRGSMHFVAAGHGADIRTDFTIDGAGTGDPSLPLSFKAAGTWKKQPFAASGRTGDVLVLRGPQRQRFPAQFEASAAHTTLRARGSIASLATLEGADASFDLRGKDLQELYQLLGIVLPATPRYSLRGRLAMDHDVWHIREIDGRLGNSDLRGELTFDRRQAVPLLTGAVESRALDFDDLAPLVGLDERPRSAAAVPQVRGRRPAPPRAAPPVRDGVRKVLPTAVLDLDRLRRMNSDVSYRAARITHAKQLPLDRMSVRVRLNDGVLDLERMNLGVAGGSLAGRARIDGTRDPAVADVHLDARALELGRLFPNVKLTKASVGRIHGDIDLKGRGNSVAQMLATSDGAVAMLMGRGEISNLLLEIAGIDGAEIVKFFLEGDRNVELRCAAAAFDVKGGLMTSRAVVLDTSDTVIYGNGQVSLASEAMDLTLRPYPKDMSILSLRSPLKIAGTFASPRVGPDKAALAARGGVALALAAVNPLLALAATVETGPGADANCGPALREASSAYQAARMAVMDQPAEVKDGERKKGLASRLLGGPAAPPQQASPARAPHAPGAPGAPERTYGP